MPKFEKFLAAAAVLNASFAVLHAFGVQIPFYTPWIVTWMILVPLMVVMGFFPGLFPGLPVLKRAVALVRR